MRKPLFVLLLMILGFFLPTTKALAYGPFVLPIHNNSVEINGGAWNYSVSCSAAQYEVDYYPLPASHGGYDFDGDEGDNVYAAASGVVSNIQNSDCPNTYPNGNPTWGCFVDIKHDVDGDSIYDYTTKYTHLVSGSITVAVGNSVSSNTLIGQMGNSGYSDGAHLHFGVQDYGSLQYLSHDYWLDPYNLNDDNATCCDIPNGCPNEGTSSQHSDFDCDAATDSDYLWASCPPTYNAEVSTCTSDVYTIHLLTVTADASTHTFTIKPYYHTGSGNSVSLKLPDSSYTMTGLGNTNNVNTWLVGDLDNDGNDDIVNVTDNGNYTYVQVYVSNGDGTFVGRDRWLKANNGYSHAFLTDMDNDDDLDLVLGYPNGSSIKWRIGTNIGSDFADLTTWSESFGSTDSHFLVGDFNGNGKGEILVGTTNSGGVELGWQRLDTTGNSATIATGWGSPSNTYLVSNLNADADGRDDFLRIDETNSTVEAYLAQYSSTLQWLSVSTMANDVGGTDGDYFVYPLDYNDDYPDLLRLNSSGTLYLGQHTSATTFEEQGDQQDIVSNLPTDGTLLFGNFGGLQSDCTAPFVYIEVADNDLDQDYDSYTPDDGDCDDTADHTYPGAPELWDTFDNDCDALIDEAFDLDGDGWSYDQGDCSEQSNNINPYAVEIPDGLDNDCDGVTDEVGDNDYDGWSSTNGDCDDTADHTYPGAPELLDDLDNDCDGEIDEDFLFEDQYIFFDFDGNGDDDPCVRRATTLLCLYDGLYGTWTVPGEVIGTGEYIIWRSGRTSYYDYMGADGIADYVLVYADVSADQFLYWHTTIAARFGSQLQIDRNLDGIMDTYLYYGTGNGADDYYLADLNGDGLADLIFREGNRFYVDDNTSGVYDYWFTFGDTTLDSQWYFADFDGDGTDGICVVRGALLHCTDTITPNGSQTGVWTFSYGYGL